MRNGDRLNAAEQLSKHHERFIEALREAGLANQSTIRREDLLPFVFTAEEQTRIADLTTGCSPEGIRKVTELLAAIRLDRFSRCQSEIEVRDGLLEVHKLALALAAAIRRVGVGELTLAFETVLAANVP